MEKNRELVEALRREAEKQECPAELRHLCEGAADVIELLWGIIDAYHRTLEDVVNEATEEAKK